jgi:hypothetical protein
MAGPIDAQEFLGTASGICVCVCVCVCAVLHRLGVHVHRLGKVPVPNLSVFLGLGEPFICTRMEVFVVMHCCAWVPGPFVAEVYVQAVHMDVTKNLTINMLTRKITQVHNDNDRSGIRPHCYHDTVRLHPCAGLCQD